MRGCRLTRSIQVFGVFHTLLLNVICLPLCMRETDRKEKIEAYQFTNIHMNLINHCITDVLVHPAIDLGYIMRDIDPGKGGRALPYASNVVT